MSILSSRLRNDWYSSKWIRNNSTKILRRLQDNNTFLIFYHFLVICSTSLNESVYLFFGFLSIETQHTLNCLTIGCFHCNNTISLLLFKWSKNYLIYIYYTYLITKFLFLYFFPFYSHRFIFYKKQRFIFPFLWLFRSFQTRKGTFLKKFVKIPNFFQHFCAFVLFC